jgi:hypothetical protein
VEWVEQMHAARLRQNAIVAIYIEAFLRASDGQRSQFPFDLARDGDSHELFTDDGGTVATVRVKGSDFSLDWVISAHALQEIDSAGQHMTRVQEGLEP